MKSAIACRRWSSIGLALAFLALASCGGGGGGGNSGPPGSKLFFTDGGNRALVSSINPTPTTTFNVDRVVFGAATGLGTTVGDILSIPSIALDAAANRMYVATQGNTFIFDNVSQADGNIAPTRTMGATINTGPPGNRAVNFFHISLDATHSILYTVDPTGEVHVFNNPTTPAGATTVARLINPDTGTTTITTTFGLAIDVGKDMLYLGADISGGGSNILVFNNASTIGTAPTTITPVTPTRTLTFAQAVGSFFLDTAGDRLYAAQFDGTILVFDHASQLTSGPVTAVRTIDPTNGVQNYIFVDTGRDKLYAVSGTQGFLIVVNNASTVNGNTFALPGFQTAFFFNVTNIALSAVAVAP